jgi:methylmalonyl-CoA/ethylmalonyl-CoA epimerase
MQEQQPAARVSAIDHVGIAVPDLDEAIEFYTSTFGLVVAVTEVNEEQGVREAMLRAPGDDGTGTAIQLLAPLSEDSSIGKFLAKNGPGLQQLAYRVSDVNDASNGLRSAGLTVLYDEPRHGTADSRVNFVHPKSAGGVLVELVEPATPGSTETDH